eukprot:gene23921-biopygen1300
MLFPSSEAGARWPALSSVDASKARPSAFAGAFLLRKGDSEDLELACRVAQALGPFYCLPGPGALAPSKGRPHARTCTLNTLGTTPNTTKCSAPQAPENDR